MKATVLLPMGLLVALFTTGCATKKYVVKTVTPIQQRVEATEGKNTEQDGKITTVTTDLAGTKEKLAETDSKAVQAGEAAKAADQKAANAQQSADGAKQAADAAKTFAEERFGKLDKTLQTMNNFTMTKSETILFGFNRDDLTDEAKAQLEGLGNEIKGMNRYVVEVQGFTDTTGPVAYNEQLSQRRAQAVARYLVNQFQIPVRNIASIGSGLAQVEDGAEAREARKNSRRVDVKVWVAEGGSTAEQPVKATPTTTTSAGNGQ